MHTPFCCSVGAFGMYTSSSANTASPRSLNGPSDWSILTILWIRTKKWKPLRNVRVQRISYFTRHRLSNLGQTSYDFGRLRLLVYWDAHEYHGITLCLVLALWHLPLRYALACRYFFIDSDGGWAPKAWSRNDTMDIKGIRPIRSCFYVYMFVCFWRISRERENLRNQKRFHMAGSWIIYCLGLFLAQ